MCNYLLNAKHKSHGSSKSYSLPYTIDLGYALNAQMSRTRVSRYVLLAVSPHWNMETGLRASP